MTQYFGAETLLLILLYKPTDQPLRLVKKYISYIYKKKIIFPFVISGRCPVFDFLSVFRGLRPSLVTLQTKIEIQCSVGMVYNQLTVIQQ